MARLLAAALTLSLSTAAFASTYSVNDLGDASDQTPGDDVCATAGSVCTLRAAIEEANAHGGGDSIVFSAAGTITLGTRYPAITGTLQIDASTHPSWVGVPVVIVDGGGVVNIGVEFAAGSNDSSLTSLKIHGFTEAAVIVSSTRVSIRRNYLGPVGGGTANQDGLQLFGSQTSAGAMTLGGVGNVISGNTRHGILASGTFHTIRDNFIGTDAAGGAALGNGQDGIHLFSGASGATIVNNVVSGNARDGIHLEMSSQNNLSLNRVGTNVAGLAAIPNGRHGIALAGGSSRNLIGADFSSSRNLVSGNSASGIHLFAGSNSNSFSGNVVGLDVSGTSALPNAVGIVVQSSNNVIGGSPIVRNVVSGNTGEGIVLDGASQTSVRSSVIGLDISGNSVIGNGAAGIRATGDLTGSTIGGFLITNAGNTISGNGLDGITVANGSGLMISQNIIGLGADQTSARGNGGHGIHLLSSTGISINGSNVISSNAQNGILIESSTGFAGGNRIGTDGAGMLDRGNALVGVRLLNTSDHLVDFNLISGNDGHGVEIAGTSSNITMSGNIIGRNRDNTADLPNQLGGVLIGDSSNGTALSGSVIAANGGPGIAVAGSATLNRFANNSIFRNAALGVDLGVDGVTANDLIDPDIGPNALQNFPVLTSVSSTPSGSFFQGTLNSTPNTQFELDFYVSGAPDPSGFGEGERHVIGSGLVFTDSSGNASFIISRPPETVGFFATSTATGPSGTSEFSGAVQITVPPTVQFSASTYSALESSGSVTITVTRTGDLSAISEVHVATSDGSAVAGSDYVAISGALIFAPGQASRTFGVTISDDTLDEADETLQLTLSSPRSASLGTPSTATVTINDDDPFPAISIGDPTETEGISLSFPVTLSSTSLVDVTFDFQTTDGSATAGEDYTSTSGTITIPAGETAATITVSVSNDSTDEASETVLVQLSNPVNATIADGEATGTIVDDDPEPVVTISDVSGLEGMSGTTPFTLTVTLSGPSSQTVTVDFATGGGTATSGTDFQPTNGTLTFAPGVLTQTITVNVNGDQLGEANETFFVNLTNAVGAVLADAQGEGLILDDDLAPIPTLSQWALMALLAALAGLATIRLSR